MNEEIKQLVEAYGGEEIESKNPHMTSFRINDDRINYYFTTGTTTIQNETDAPSKYVIKTLEDMEEMLNKHYGIV